MAIEYSAGNGNFKSAFDFDSLNHEAFMNGGEIDISNYLANSANQKKSDYDLKTSLENEEDEEKAKDNLVAAGEQLENAREEQERAREEAWDNSMHNVAGMDLSGVEIDGIIDTIKNPLRKAEIIAKRAKDKNISPEEAEKQLNMTLAYLDAKKKVDNHTATANDIATVHDVERSPEKSAVVRDNVQYVQDNMRGVKNPNDLKASVSITQGNQEAMNDSTSALSAPIGTSFASQQDGKPTNLTITNNFNSNAGGIKSESVVEPINAIPSLEQRQLASMCVAASNAI